MSRSDAAPGAHVLAAFGARGDAVPLAGGQDRSWRAGQVVLKPLDASSAALDWLESEVAPRVAGASLRVSLPVRSVDGAWVVDGWTAAPYLPGRHVAGRWSEIADVGAEFAGLLADVERPAFLAERDDPWARADALAWGEVSGDGVGLVPFLADLLAAARPAAGVEGIVHGDLSGNVLFSDDLPPAVLDLSLYWRPPAYGTAVVAVDAVCWNGAPTSLLEELCPGPDGAALLVRALLFRLLADHENGRPDDDPAYAAYAACASRVLDLADVTV